MKNPPEIIYLQYYGDSEPEEGEVSESDVTWCVDRIFDSDIEYTIVPTPPDNGKTREEGEPLPEGVETFDNWRLSDKGENPTSVTPPLSNPTHHAAQEADSPAVKPGDGFEEWWRNEGKLSNSITNIEFAREGYNAALASTAQELEQVKKERNSAKFEHALMVTRNLELVDENSTLRAQVERLKAALTRLRDCDWTISLPDRMDAVRDIARAALTDQQQKG